MEIDSSQKVEGDYTPFLTKEEKEALAKHFACFDLELSEEQLKFVDENGYLVVDNLVEDEICDRIKRESFEVMQIFSYCTNSF